MKSLRLIAGAALVVTALAPIPAAHALDPAASPESSRTTEPRPSRASR